MEQLVRDVKGRHQIHLPGVAIAQRTFGWDSIVVETSPYHSSTASQNSFSRSHLYNRSRPESCGSCLRRGQARRHLTEDLLVVSGYRPLHMNTSAFYACFLRQPLELTLKKDFQLLRSQAGNGKW